MYISSRSAKDCEAAAAELNKLGPGKAIALPADMQKLSEVDRLVAELGKREGALNVLVNNAGTHAAHQAGTLELTGPRCRMGRWY